MEKIKEVKIGNTIYQFDGVDAENVAPILKGDETIVADLTQDKKFVEIHLDQIFKESLANKDFLSKNYMAQHKYIGDIYENEFYQWCLNTPKVVDGSLFVVETQTETPTSAVQKGFPLLESGTILYGFFYNGQSESPIVILTDKGIFKITDGTSALTCVLVGGISDELKAQIQVNTQQITLMKSSITNLNNNKQDKIAINNGQPTTEVAKTMEVNGVNYDLPNVEMTFTDKLHIEGTRLGCIAIKDEKNNTTDYWNIESGGRSDKNTFEVELTDEQFTTLFTNKQSITITLSGNPSDYYKYDSILVKGKNRYDKAITPLLLLNKSDSYLNYRGNDYEADFDNLDLTIQPIKTKTETWTFELEDGSIITKEVVLK